MKQRICRSTLLAALAILLPAIHSWSQSAEGIVGSVSVRSGAAPGVRFTSRLMVCDEEFYAGRWVNRYWTSTGQIKPEVHLQGQSETRSGLPIDAFQLGIEGQNLAGSWKWIGVEQKHLTNLDGQLVTIELESTARPITVKLNTEMHGESIMVRWLEITNRGTKATAITAMSPWSGPLWNTAGYSERVGKEAPFEVATTKYEIWGHEGAWEFHPVGKRNVDRLRDAWKIRLGPSDLFRTQPCYRGMVRRLSCLERQLDDARPRNTGHRERRSAPLLRSRP